MRTRSSVVRRWVVAVVLLAAGAPVGRAADPEAGARAALGRLSASSSPAAAEQLRDIVRYDDRLALRVAAARALGECPASNAAAQLAWSVGRGGPDVVRRALETSLAARTDGLRGWERALADPDLDRLGRVRLVEALHAFRDARSRELLLRQVLDDAPAVRAAGIAAVAAREDARVFLEGVLAMSLERHADPDTTRAALLAAGVLDAEALDRLVDGLPPRLGSGPMARALRDRARRRREQTLRERVAEPSRHRYAPPPSPDPPPEHGRPVDLVVALDFTVSETLFRAAYFAEVERLVREERARGADLRLAFVGYRDELRDRNQRETGWRVRAFPLSFDLQAAQQDGQSIETGKVGDRAASIYPALEAAIARMNWRADAERRVVLFTAEDVDQLRRSLALVGVHREGDGVRLEVRVRSGGKRTDRLDRLARAAGGELGEFRVRPVRPRGR